MQPTAAPFPVAQGKTNAESGLILGISPRTVQNHLAHVYDKLGVETCGRHGAGLRDRWEGLVRFSPTVSCSRSTPECATITPKKGRARWP